MPRLPTLSGREVVRVFERFGWQVVRQSSSHIIRDGAGGGFRHAFDPRSPRSGKRHAQKSDSRSWFNCARIYRRF